MSWWGWVLIGVGVLALAYLAIRALTRNLINDDTSGD